MITIERKGSMFLLKAAFKENVEANIRKKTTSRHVSYMKENSESLIYWNSPTVFAQFRNIFSWL